MIEITDDIYHSVAKKLTATIDNADFFSGTILSEHEQFDSSLTATLIIYRGDNEPENSITDIVPVWWEFHTTATDGEEINDFSFSELRKHIVTE